MASNIQKIYLTISIDTECDHDPKWVRSNPIAFDSINEGIPNRLQPAFESVGAVPTYLLTVEAMENEECVKTLTSINGEHELGTHLHPAFIEPHKKYHDYAGVDSPDFQSGYSEDIEYRKLENLSNLFADKFGYRPTSFRAGRFGASAQSLNNLQKLGYVVDSSVTPHVKWTAPNAVADFRKAPEQPYFSSQHDISIATAYTQDRILEAPVTIMPRLLRRTPIWFRPWFASVNQMKQIFRYQLKKHADKEILNINMMFHSMEVIEKASPYPQNAAEVQRFLDEMLEGLSWCKEEGVEFCSLSSLHEPFRKIK